MGTGYLVDGVYSTWYTERINIPKGSKVPKHDRIDGFCTRIVLTRWAMYFICLHWAHFRDKDPTNHGFWNPPERKCRIVVLMWSSGPKYGRLLSQGSKIQKILQDTAFKIRTLL